MWKEHNMSDKAPVKRVLIAGPMPPPWGGAAVSFALFKQWVEDQDIGVNVFNLRWRRSSQESLFGVAALWRNLLLFCLLFKESLAYSHLVLFGSQRLIAWFGGPLIVMLRLLGCTVSLRIFGGGFDSYLASFPFPLRHCLYWSLGFAKTIVLQTDEVQRALQPSISTDLKVVENYRNKSEFISPSASSPKPFRFIYAGFVRAEKGIDELIKAFTALRETNEEVELHIVGPLFAEVKSRAGIFVLGEKEQGEVVQLLAKSHCLVYPTRWPREGIPGVIIEAGLAGLPIITTKWKAIPTIIEDGKNGLLVEAGDEGQLFGQMKRVLEDEQLRNRLAANNKDCMENYTVERVCPRLAQSLGLLTSD